MAPEGNAPVQNSASTAPFFARHSLLHYLLLALLAFGLYAQTIGYSYSLDDPISTTKNRFVQQGLSGIGTLVTHGYMYGENLNNSGAYRPLALTTFAVENEIAGNSPGLSHFINVLLYALCAVLVYAMLKTWLHGYHFLLPFAAALLWVAHPLHTEVTASIKSRDEILALVFLGLTVLSVFSWYDKKRPLQLGLSALWFMLALLSKESAITFLAVVPLSLYFFREIPLKQIVVSVIPMAVAAGVYLLMRASFLDSAPENLYLTVIDNTLAGATNTGERLATAFTILLRYIGLLIFPHPLSYDYSFRQIPIVNFSNIWAILSVVVYAALAIFAVVTIKKKHLLSFCILFYLATISIVSNLIVDIGATIGERFLFVPSIAFCLALAWGLGLLLSKTNWLEINLKPIPVMAAAGAIVLLYSAKTVARNFDWKDNNTLFASGVETAPNSARTNFHYGYQLFKQAERTDNQAEKDRLHHQADLYMTRAVEIYPDLRDAQRNLGLVNINLKNFEKAALHLQNALRMSDTLKLANFYTGLAKEFTGKPEEAIAFYDKELQLSPSHAQTYHYKGTAYYKLSEKPENQAMAAQYADLSIQNLTRAIQLDPKNAESYFQLGFAYGKKGNFAAAVQSLEQGIALQPNNAQALLYLGIGNGILGNPDKAIDYLKKCIEIEPKLAEAYKNLAYALREKGRYQEAVQYLQQGLQHNPEDEALKQLLAQMQAMGG